MTPHPSRQHSHVPAQRPGALPFARRVGALALTLALLAGAGNAAAGTMGSIDVVTRPDGRVLPVYPKDGRSYVVGTPGQEYGIRVCNTTGERVLAVMSVDGVNIVSGETASPSQAGYVLMGYECADINGWRKNLASTAAFYFTELPDAYATRTGRPDNVGVIGVAFFREKPQRTVWKDSARIAASPAPESAARQDAAGAMSESRANDAHAQGTGGRDGRADAGAGSEDRHRPRPLRGVVRADHAVRARERDAERDARDPVRPARESRRVGRAAAASDRAIGQSVSRVDAAFRPGSADPLSEGQGSIDCAGRGPLAYWRAMPAPAIVAAPRDEDLMLAYAADDAAAFDTLYARHKGGVYRYLLRQCAHAGVADELFQDVWMNVIRSRATYVPSAKFTTWLYRIAHHRLIDHWRASGHVELVTAGSATSRTTARRTRRTIRSRRCRRRSPTSRRRAPARASSRVASRPRAHRCLPCSARPSCCTRKAASSSPRSPH